MKEEIKNKVIPEICSRQYQPYVKAKRLISPTETLGDDGIGIRAFTLIELLVVVLIIGILSAIALPQYQKAVMKSRYIQTMILVDSMYNAQQIYFLSNGRYADNFEDLDISMPSGEITSHIANYKWGTCYFDNIIMYCYLLNGPTYLRYWEDPTRFCRFTLNEQQSFNEKFCKSMGASCPENVPAGYTYKQCPFQ